MPMAQVIRFPKKREDGSISQKQWSKGPDGKMQLIESSVFDDQSPVVSLTFSNEILKLVGRRQVVDISSYMEAGKYEYDIVDHLGNIKEASNIFRVFLNGLNISKDIYLKENRKMFCFPHSFPAEFFGMKDNVLIIDYVEKGIVEV